jgi:hypothetical protein
MPHAGIVSATPLRYAIAPVPASVGKDDFAFSQNDADGDFGFRIDCPLSPRSLFHRVVGDRGVAGAGA